MSKSALATYTEFYREQRAKVPRSLDDRTDEENVEGKIVIITGCNTGIGKVTALEIAKRGAIVVMACRDLQKAQEAMEEIIIQVPKAQLCVKKLDLADLSSVREFAKEIIEIYPHVNILINNAGYSNSTGALMKTKDGFENHIGINHLGPFLLTVLLLDHIKKGGNSRIVTVASTMHLRGEIDLENLMLDKACASTSYAYSNSKLANALFTKELAKRLQGTSVTTYSLCPGFVKTDIFRYQSWLRSISTNLALALIGISAEEGCQTTLFCALSTNCAHESGKMYRFGKLWESASDTLDGELASKLWDVSEKLVGVQAP